MEKIRKMIARLYGNDVVRYVFFGGCTTLVNLVSFYVLRKCGLQLTVANIISIIAAILFETLSWKKERASLSFG